MMELEPKRCSKRCNINSSIDEVSDELLVDRISELPEEIILGIISRLTIKEAARTSTLSSKWRYLWTYFAGSLNFDASLIVLAIQDIVYNFYFGLRSKEVGPVHRERVWFLRWINEVLKSHQGPLVHELRICFDVGAGADIDRWINFAIQKCVQKLELDFSSTQLDSSVVIPIFPSHILSNSRFTSLKDLRLTFVNVTGEVLEHFLSQSLSLELLSVVDSSSLVNLKVFSPLLRLKYLQLWRCHKLKSLEISVASLVSFKYGGPKISNPFKNVPSLVDVCFGGQYCMFLSDSLCQLSGLLLQLETLQLCLNLKLWKNIPQLSNLKHLELMTSLYDTSYLVRICSLLKACPLLYHFTLKATRINSAEPQDVPEQHTFPNLKVVEIVGFGGLTADVKIAMCLLEKAVFLDKLIVDPRLPVLRRHLSDFVNKDPEDYKLAIQRCKDFEAKVPSRVKFVCVTDESYLAKYRNGLI